MENGSVKLLPLLLLAGCSTLSHQFRHLTGDLAGRLADEVVIERDAWGVPHIHGESDAAAAFGVAWAMAEDDFRGVEEGYIRALGRSAYQYGAGYLGDDLVRAAFEVESWSRAEYAREPESGRRLLDGFALGLNYWLRKHPDMAPRAVARYEGWMVLARARRAQAAQQVAGLRLGEVALLAGEPNAGSRPASWLEPGAAWAVAPGRSGGGDALLLASVSAPFSGPERPYELEVRSDAGWHVYGLAELGMPVPFSGRNDRLGWAHAYRGDPALVQRVVFDGGGDSLAYRLGGESGRAEAWVDTVLVNTAAGVEPRAYRFLRTRHGPVIARRGDTALVVQLPGMSAGGRLQQWYAMGRAGSLAEFQAALARGALSELATAYADVAGNILGSGAGEELVSPGSGEVRLGTPAAGWPGLVPPLSGASVALLGRLALGAEPVGFSEEIARLVNEWEQVGGRDSRRAFAMDSAIELLRGWDGHSRAAVSSANRDSAGGASPPGRTALADSAATAAADSARSAAATLYYSWQRALAETGTDDTARPDTAAFPRFRALETAVAALRAEWGRVLVPWSEAMRLQRPAAAGGGGGSVVAGVPAASLFVLHTQPAAGGGRGGPQQAVGGTAAVMVTEFAPVPRTASVVLGPAAAPGTGEYPDQAARYGAGELKDAWFGSGAVRTRYHPGQRARVLQPETAAAHGP